MGVAILAAVVIFLLRAGFVGGVTTVYCKSRAAAIIQGMLRLQGRTFWTEFKGDPAEAARSYVEAAWIALPEVFDGKRGPRPHRASTVIYALGLAVECLDRAGDANNRDVVMLVLARAVADLERHVTSLRLSKIDHALIVRAMEIAGPIMTREGVEAEVLG